MNHPTPSTNSVLLVVPPAPPRHVRAARSCAHALACLRCRVLSTCSHAAFSSPYPFPLTTPACVSRSLPPSARSPRPRPCGCSSCWDNRICSEWGACWATPPTAPWSSQFIMKASVRASLDSARGVRKCVRGGILPCPGGLAVEGISSLSLGSFGRGAEILPFAGVLETHSPPHAPTHLPHHHRPVPVGRCSGHVGHQRHCAQRAHHGLWQPVL
jgi:hypothetical protein